MIFVVVGREEGVMVWVLVVAMVVVVSTARVLWHPCTMNSGKQSFLSLSKALLSGHDFLTAVVLPAGLLPAGLPPAGLPPAVVLPAGLPPAGLPTAGLLGVHSK
jgi:hypothetical protein